MTALLVLLDLMGLPVLLVRRDPRGLPVLLDQTAQQEPLVRKAPLELTV